MQIINTATDLYKYSQRSLLEFHVHSYRPQSQEATERDRQAYCMSSGIMNGEQGLFIYNENLES